VRYESPVYISMFHCRCFNSAQSLWRTACVLLPQTWLQPQLLNSSLITPGCCSVPVARMFSGYTNCIITSCELITSPVRFPCRDASHMLLQRAIVKVHNEMRVIPSAVGAPPSLMCLSYSLQRSVLKGSHSGISHSVGVYLHATCFNCTVHEPDNSE
jgi:hypothetical protein